MCYRKIMAGVMLASLISVANSGSLLAASHGGGMGGGSHGGMGGGFSGGMSSSFRGGMSSGFHSFATPSFNSGARNFSYSTQHFSAAPHTGGNNIVSRNPSNSFNNSFHTQQFNFRNDSGFGNNAITREGNVRMPGLGNMNEHFQSNVLHPVNPQSWQHNANWLHNREFADGRVHMHDHDHDFDHFHFHSFVYIPFWFPFWWDYSPFYSWYGYPYYSDYCYGYAPSEYYGYDPVGYTSMDLADSEVTKANSPVIDKNPSVSEDTASASSDWGESFLSSARDAFRSGSYSDALRLANHAAVEMPKSAKGHELMSLALFALKDYQGANIEAHTALSFGPPSDWNTLYSYYNDLPTYTKQLDALVDYINSNKGAMDARFVLAYQDIMMGHKDAAKTQLDEIVAKIPKDRVAAQLLKDLGGSTSSAIENPAKGASTVESSAASGEKKQ